MRIGQGHDRGSKRVGFIAGATLGAVVGENNALQLFNPVGSSVVLQVYSIRACGGAAITINLRRHNTALTTLQFAGVNLRMGGTAGVGELRSEGPAGQVGTLIADPRVLANTLTEFLTEAVATLDPGEGIHVSVGTSNNVLSAVYVWDEQAV